MAQDDRVWIVDLKALIMFIKKFMNMINVFTKFGDIPSALRGLPKIKGVLAYLHIGGIMVEVVGINGEAFLINATLIEKIEFIPETKITLTTGKYYLVKDSKEDIVNKIIKYNQKIIRGITAD